MQVTSIEHDVIINNVQSLETFSLADSRNYTKIVCMRKSFFFFLELSVCEKCLVRKVMGEGGDNLIIAALSFKVSQPQKLLQSLPYFGHVARYICVNMKCRK